MTPPQPLPLLRGGAKKIRFIKLGSKLMENILEKVYAIIKDRRANPKDGSYVNYLQKEGVDKICKKIGEESAEVIIAAKNNDKKELIYEIADLYFHSLVLLEESNVTLEDIYNELQTRFK